MYLFLESILFRKIIYILLLSLFFAVNCSIQINGGRPQGVPEKAVWYEKNKKWGYQDKTGKAVFWYKNGNIAHSAFYMNNKLEGDFTSWYYHGSIEIKGSYKNDLSDGLWKWWWPGGNLKMTGGFVEGKEDGSWKFYDEKISMKLTCEIIYKKGRQLSEKKFKP